MFIKKNLIRLRDDKTVLRNPHKGWYWHFYDNGMKNPKYGSKTEGHENFPGLNHLYLRIDWSDIQPEKDKFDWSEIDKVMEEWGAKGYRFSLRVCCSETSERQCFATPEWLYNMGCAGGFYPPFPNEDPAWWERFADDDSYKVEIFANPVKYCKKYWEPDYCDPLFLEYLDKFIENMAEKFDNDPRVEFVDFGSYGNWGEGHNAYGSNVVIPFEVYQAHLRIHMKHFKNKTVMINDDIINNINGTLPEEQLIWTENKQEFLDECVSMRMGFRDDSILTDVFDVRDYHTLVKPEMFDFFHPYAPVDIEGAHYNFYKDNNPKAKLVFIEAAKRAHATYAGFHGYIDEWLQDNFYMTEYLANRLGYWYFINEIEHMDTVIAGTKMRIKMKWENAGFGLCYNKYDLDMKLTAKDGTEYIYRLSEFDNRKIMNESTSEDVLYALLSDDMKSGEYDMSFRLSETIGNELTVIKLGIKSNFKDDDGFYKLSTLEIVR